MKTIQLKVLSCFIVLMFFCSCENEPELNNPIIIEDPVETKETLASNYLPFFKLGDELRNNSNMNYDSITMIIDSTSKFKMDINSFHNTSSDASTYFIEIELNINDNIKFLNLLALEGQVFDGPILTTFNIGDTISTDIAMNNKFDWFTDSEVKLGNTRWLKYHIFTPNQEPITESINIGENYLVLKFGEENEERIGWLNVFFQDSLCYLKEGFYSQSIGKDIIVGAK